MGDERQEGRNRRAVRPIRCAIYTRKSTEEGLEQEFNSLDAQREAGEAYVKSQQHEGWVCLPSQYDDGGFTGANMDRPAIRRLLHDIEAGKVDCVVVYKVDRLSRSLLDFARIMETFERHNVSFVSVTQAFNTATSMGRLVLNVLLSFAQFEREMISRADAGQDRGRPSQGKMVGRHAGPGVLGGRDEARRGRGRSRSRPRDLSDVPGAAVAAGGREGTQRPRLADQMLDDAEEHRSRRTAVQQEVAVRLAHERRLHRQDSLQGRGPRRGARHRSWTSGCSRRRRRS